MESNNAPNLNQISSKLPVSIFTRIANLFHTLVSPARPKIVVTIDIKNADGDVNLSQHEVIINLLNKGKHYDEAAHIAQVAQEWNIDVAGLDSNQIAVKGQSVWIDLDN